MAERRMFAKTIIDSDAFIDMPVTARLLYYDLSMRADDDGFVNSPKKIMRMIGASDDDLRILLARRFLIAFEGGIVVIKHWRIHNYIRNDRYHETPYTKEKAMLTLDDNRAYTLADDKRSTDGIPNDNQRSTEDRLGKVSLGKDSKDNISSAEPTPYHQIIALYHQCCTKMPKVQKVTKARQASMRTLFKEYGIEGFEDVFAKAGASDFLSGRTGNWNGCSFDWLIKPSNFLKVLEGTYDNRGHKKEDALKAWAEGADDGQEADSNIIDISSFSIS